MTTNPQTTQDFLALELATDFALDQGMQFPDVATWACSHWPEFLEFAEDPEAQARYLRQVEAAVDDFEAFWAYATALAGPCPETGSDADKLAWMGRLDEAEASLRRGWAKK